MIDFEGGYRNPRNADEVKRERAMRRQERSDAEVAYFVRRMEQLNVSIVDLEAWLAERGQTLGEWTLYELAGLAEVMIRPADWTVPNGEIYTHLGPGVDENGNTKRVLGDWIPNVRNENATAYTFVPRDVPGETETERSARLREAFSTPSSRRDSRDIKMFEELYADDGRQPVVTLRCATCRPPRRMAKIYKVDRSYVLMDAWSYTFYAARIDRLNRAMAAREQGHEWVADVEIAAVDVKQWPVQYVLDPYPKGHVMHGPNWGAEFDSMLIGCEHHGNAKFSYAWLRNVAKAGEDVMVHPHERFFVLESEMPTDD